MIFKNKENGITFEFHQEEIIKTLLKSEHVEVVEEKKEVKKTRAKKGE